MPIQEIRRNEMLDRGEPLYLGCSMEKWLEVFLATESIDEDDRVWWGIAHFGEPFMRRATELINTLSGQQQSELIRCMANAGRQSVPYLARLMEHSSADVRAAACTALVEALNTGFDEPAYTAPIVQMLTDFFHGPRLSQEQCAEFFERLDVELAAAEYDNFAPAEIYAALTANLDNNNDRVRIAAIEALERLGFSDELCPSIFRVLLYVLEHEKNDQVREIAAHLLAGDAIAEHLERLNKPDLLLLLKVLDDITPTVRGEVASLFEKLYRKGSVDLDAFMQPTGEVKLRLGPRATCELFAMVPELVPALLLKLHDSRADVRACAAIALGRASKNLGWTSGRRNDAVPALAQLLDDPDSAVRVAAVQALVLLKKPSSTDVDVALSKVARDSDPAVCREASLAIQCLAGEIPISDEDDTDGPSPCQPITMPECVHGVEARCRELATAPSDCVMAALHDRDIAIRIAAIEALEKTDGTNLDAIHCLFQSLQDPCPHVRWIAQRALRWASIRRTEAWHR